MAPKTTATTAKPWKQQKRAWHKATPPSGMEGVELRIPALTDLFRNEAVPQRLRALALKSAAHPAALRGVMADTLQLENAAEDAGEKTLEEAIDESSELRQAIDDVVEIQKHLIVENVRIGGELLTLEDLDDPDFPAPDAEWLGSVMLREIDVDARGVRLGIEPLDRWASFRHFHDCPESCVSCQALQDEFSSVDLGVV